MEFIKRAAPGGQISLISAAMSSKLRISSINVRGMRNEKQRRSIMRQLISHSDCVLLQDTHIDESLEKVIQKEFPGQWAFSNKTTASAGVAIAVFGFGKNMSNDFEHISDDGSSKDISR